MGHRRSLLTERGGEKAANFDYEGLTEGDGRTAV